MKKNKNIYTKKYLEDCMFLLRRQINNLWEWDDENEDIFNRYINLLDTAREVLEYEIDKYYASKKER